MAIVNKLSLSLNYFYKHKIFGHNGLKWYPVLPSAKKKKKEDIDYRKDTFSNTPDSKCGVHNFSPHCGLVVCLI